MRGESGLGQLSTAHVNGSPDHRCTYNSEQVQEKTCQFVLSFDFPCWVAQLVSSFRQNVHMIFQDLRKCHTSFYPFFATLDMQMFASPMLRLHNSLLLQVTPKLPMPGSTVPFSSMPSSISVVITYQKSTSTKGCATWATRSWMEENTQKSACLIVKKMEKKQHSWKPTCLRLKSLKA